MRAILPVAVFLLLVLFSIGLGWVFLNVNTSSPTPDGSAQQSPLLYIFLFVLVCIAGGVLTRVFNSHSSTYRFSFWGFLNVALGALLVGGILHEFVHILLLQHPAQFRVHFGDPRAVFSTCCLAPGEIPHEEIAYAIQFLVGLFWMVLFRGVFIQKRSEKGAPLDTRAEKHALKEAKSKPATPHAPNFEEEIEKEWENEKKKVTDLLNLHEPIDPGMSAVENELEREIRRLEKLKTARGRGE